MKKKKFETKLRTLIRIPAMIEQMWKDRMSFSSLSCNPFSFEDFSSLAQFDLIGYRTPRSTPILPHEKRLRYFFPFSPSIFTLTDPRFSETNRFFDLCDCENFIKIIVQKKKKKNSRKINLFPHRRNIQEKNIS